MRASSFVLVPWSEDFLAALKDLIAESSRGGPGRAVVVFPHSRPRRYLTDYYRREGKTPLLLPRMMTGQEFVARCRAAWSGPEQTPRQASRLDQVALLRRGLERVADPGQGLGETTRSMAHFFPWGVRLAGLMEEGFNQLSDLRDLPHMTDQVEPFAAALLEKLGRIRDLYLEELDKANLSTPGLDAYLAARGAESGAPLPDFLRDRTVILAGFVRLTSAEDSLFRYLWEQGALVALHTDPALIRGRGHWSTRDHAQWMRRWGADCALRAASPGKKRAGEAPGSTGPEIRFFAGYDLHSQLEELQKLLERHAAEEGAFSQTVVLPHSDLLMPTLHHLPRKDVNISLGYPLGRSLLARLIETVFQTRESRRGDGRVHWRPFLALVSHPYLRMLRREEDASASAALHSPAFPPLRDLLRLLERNVRKGPRLLDMDDALDAVLDEASLHAAGTTPGGAEGKGAESGEAHMALLEQCFEVLIHAWADLSTLRQTAQALGSLCELLLRYGGSIWKAFPIDAECLTRLRHNLIPALEDNDLADEPLPVQTLFAIVRQSLAEERVPFEADPLTGLQVLGMLETRLLRFDRVYALDLTEDKLPGPPRQDPLLPDSLRTLLGLPDAHDRDRLAAHTFQRLLAGAKEVWLFWQEGVEQSGLLDSKKERSRFVEEALWREEKAQGARLSARDGNGPLRNASFPPIAPPVRQQRVIARTRAVAAGMDALLSRPLSPTRLDAYLRCPVRFFYEHVCRIKLLDEVREGDDPLGVGVVLHETLRRAYAPLVGETLGADRPSGEELERIFLEELDKSGLKQQLPAESWLMFRESGPALLKKYRAGQAQGIVPLQVEQEIRSVIRVDGVERTLYGVLDRVDRRERGEVVLDYKSGALPKIRADLWEDDGLWRHLADWNPDGAGAEEDPLFALGERMSSLQLPCYMFLRHQEKGVWPANAAWIPLATGGEETWLLPWDARASAAREALTERIPVLVDFVLRHMARSQVLKAREGDHCRYCPYYRSC